MFDDVLSVLTAAASAFLIGLALTPVITHYLYSHKAWKKTPGKRALGGETAHEFNRLHSANEVRAPRMGGIIIWASVFITIMLLAFITKIFPDVAPFEFNFLSRAQTWIPLAALMIGAFVGLADDLLVIRPGGEGIQLRYRLGLVFILSLATGWWFWAKLGVVAVSIPFAAPLYLGWLIIPLFVFVALCVYASGVIDGIDGLSGGVFSSIFAAYAIIAFMQGQTDLSAFCAAIVGGTIAFLWFNVPPARFYMSDTGTMALTLALAVVAFMTDQIGGGIGIADLPLIGGLLVITVLSNVLQICWKKIFHKKLMRIAPLHHHFEAIGWPGSKVVMRYWILSVVLAFSGVLLAVLSY